VNVLCDQLIWSRFEFVVYEPSLSKPLMFLHTDHPDHPTLENNGYGRPLDFVEVIVDLDQAKVCIFSSR
jgi:Cu2+-containing amine oxidase